jgi:hypothetical protein
MKKIVGILSLVIVFLCAILCARSAHITKSEISGLEKSGHLVQAGSNAWKTRGGVILKGKDPSGLTRLEHVMKHTEDAPRRPKHGVFELSKTEVIDLMDEVWSKIKSGELKGGGERGGKTVYTYRAGRPIGYLGGREGKRKGYPKLKSVRMVLKNGTSEVVTFFPY